MEYFIKANLSDPDNPNQELVNFLKELANYEKSVTNNYFKFHAYRKAAGELAKFPEKIKSGAEAKELDGIGKSIGTPVVKCAYADTNIGFNSSSNRCYSSIPIS